MEPGLAFTLCGLGICFLIPAFILGFINRSKQRDAQLQQLQQ